MFVTVKFQIDIGTYLKTQCSSLYCIQQKDFNWK